MSFRTNLLLALLGGLVVIVLLIGQPGEKRATGTAAPKQRFTMEHFDLKRFDEHGALRYRLLSEHIEQDAVSGESMITLPKTWLFEAGKPKWVITADAGWLNSQQTLARLNHNVVIVEPSNPGLRATTSKLTVDLAAEQAENDVPVNITMAANKIQGVGLFADFAQKKLTLKSNVKGIYVP